MEKDGLENKMRKRLEELKKERNNIQDIKVSKLCFFFKDIFLDTEKIYTIKEQHQIFNKVLEFEISYSMLLFMFRQWKKESNTGEKIQKVKKQQLEEKKNEQQKKEFEISNDPLEDFRKMLKNRSS